MSSEQPLSVLLLWHQHQPLYKDGLTNRYELPWVRLHATKDYYDMVAILDDFPAIKANFNLVPSLLTQLDDYASGQAHDKFLELTAKAAGELAAEDKRFILQNFFMAHWEHMVDPHPRYRELLDKRGRSAFGEMLDRNQTYFKEQDWRDLQTWFNLCWFDPYWQEKDPFIKGLFEKGKNFTENEKKNLIAKQLEICGLIVAKHKELQDRGQIEVTTTPFYHPILPLLCDTEAARPALPQMTLPTRRFQHPEDAKEQLRRAHEDYTRRFGRAPQGLWPSEGSVSEEAAALIAETGIRWVATDEGILARTLAPGTFKREDIYEPYQLAIGDHKLHFFFRDHELSDAIGFAYSSWDPDKAADDFVRRLHDIRSQFKDKTRSHVVPVVLDGENCWEYYPQDGNAFLRALYTRLGSDPMIKTVRACDYLDGVREARTLTHLFPGSWINTNFAIWIGHPEDNVAWNLLGRTRQFLVNNVAARTDRKDSSEIKLAWEEIYIAEGSDWCWWYGGDHSSANDEMFDYLFRKHLMNVYTLLGEKVPEDLHLPIKRKGNRSLAEDPVDFIHPILDGRITNYFEWRCAGIYHTDAGTAGTMQKSENLIKTLYYGFDLENLYVRLDLNKPLTADTLKGVRVRILIHAPTTQEIDAEFLADNKIYGRFRTKDSAGRQDEAYPIGAYKNIVEIALPLAKLGNPDRKDFEVSVLILRDALEQERWPTDTVLKVPFPTSDTFAESWHI